MSFSLPSINDAEQHPPQFTAPDGARTWITRATNFVIATTQVNAGSVISGDALPDESIVLLPDVGAVIDIGGEHVQAPADSLVVLPPGRARIESLGQGTIVHCCSSQAQTLMNQAGNRADYAEPRPTVAPLVPWPAPADGFKVRVYHLPHYTRPGEKMRIFRCTNLMVNVVVPAPTPRDTRALTPHSHADFEQATLCVQGRHIHHLRTPWTPDMHTWRDDWHAEVGAPSVTVIPTGIVHTSRNINDGPSQLIDVFAPPRADFALHPTWCCNGADYPLPEALQARATA